MVSLTTLGGFWPPMVVVMRLGSPGGYFSKLSLGPRHHRLMPPQIDAAAVAGDGDQFTCRDRRTCKLCPIRRDVERHAAASNDAGFCHLARDECGMGGAG